MSDTIHIPLTKGFVAVISAADERLAKHKWHALVRSNTVYAGRDEWPSRKKLLLHREVIGEIPTGMVVDHIDGNGLVCTRDNLRVVTEITNHRNRVSTHKGSSGSMIGVSYHAAARKWRARIRVHGRELHIGLFATEAEAIAARLVKERELWGIEPRRAALHGEEQ